jgi:hypothetical protein
MNEVDGAPLGWSVVENALLVPTASRALYRDIEAGVFDSEGRAVQASLLFRSWTPPQIVIPPDISGLDLGAVETVDAPHLYGGFFFHHFGHFLLEGLSRLWALEDYGPLPVVWAAGGPPDPWQVEILNLLGLEAPMLFPDRPLRFRRLVIPDPGFVIQGRFHPRHARFLARVEAAPPPGTTGPRVWLSRTGNADSMRRSNGEARLEATLAEHGWHVVRPEDRSVLEQLRTMAGASVVAGLEGSAFLGAVLLRQPPGPFILLRRAGSRTFETIAARRGILELDLYGVQRTESRKHLTLVDPVGWAKTVHALADRLEAAKGDPAARDAIKTEAEIRHSPERWRKECERRYLARALARGYELRHRLRQRLGRLRRP